jgi:simple sugar transport system substrate-binding protein
VVAGESVPPRVVVPDKTFGQQQAVAALPDRKY